jgi:hypothetical protein
MGQAVNTPSYLADEARQLAEVRRAAVARGQGSETAPSSGAADAPDSMLGQFGAVALRELNTGGRVYAAGSIILADVVMSWRPKNRAALQRQRRVAFFTRPVSDKVSKAI